MQLYDSGYLDARIIANDLPASFDSSDRFNSYQRHTRKFSEISDLNSELLFPTFFCRFQKCLLAPLCFGLN